jgi:hypothetical protein
MWAYIDLKPFLAFSVYYIVQWWPVLGHCPSLASAVPAGILSPTNITESSPHSGDFIQASYLW